MSDQNIVQKIEAVLAQISQELQLHDGGVSFVEFKNGVAYIEFQGACLGCPASSCGLTANIEQKLKAAVPQIRNIIII